MAIFGDYEVVIIHTYRVAIIDFFFTKSHLDCYGLPFSSPYDCSLAEDLSFSARASFIRHSWRELQTREIKGSIIGSLPY